MDFKAKISKVVVGATKDGTEFIQVTMDFNTMCSVEHLRMLARSTGWLYITMEDPQLSFDLDTGEVISRRL